MIFKITAPHGGYGEGPTIYFYHPTSDYSLHFRMDVSETEAKLLKYDHIQREWVRKV